MNLGIWIRLGNRWGWLLGLSCLAVSCASVSSPDGGPKDEDPPEVVVEESTPNEQTNFEKQDIVLTFNEWVQLQDEFRQIVISPPMETRPEVKLKGKRLILSFAEEEELKPDVTYTINFGEAVQDLTERNPAENLRFVFATGDKIDSLSVRGRLVDAFTGEAVEDGLFMLYTSEADSVVYQERPYYFARSDKEGNFRIQNLRAGDFKAFALKDGNLNYLYDQPNELIGFLPGPVSISDTQELNLEIRLFDERPPINLTRVDTSRYGRLKLTFNQPPIEVRLAPESAFSFFYREEDQDSLLLWYDLPDREEQVLFLTADDTTHFDTLRFIPPSKDTFRLRRSLQLVNSVSSRQNPFRALRLAFNHPLQSIDSSRFVILKDSVRLDSLPLTFSRDSSRARELAIRFNWQEDSSYTLRVLPGGVTDRFGLSLPDTLTFDFRVEARKRFGTLNLSFINFPQDTAYYIQLQKGAQVVESYSLKGEGEFDRRLPGLSPGQYDLLIVKDRNENGQWDPGRYLQGILPEKIIRRQPDQLRANWEVDFTLDFSNPQPDIPAAPPAGDAGN